MSVAALLVMIVTGAASAQERRPSGTIVVSNMNDNTATIIDAGTGRVRATLPTGEGPHEVAISHDGRTALVSNYGVRGKPGNSITVIDVATASVRATLTIDGYQRPHGMAFLPGDTIVIVTSEPVQKLLRLDVRTGHVVGALDTRGRTSHMVALAARGERAFTANIADGTVSALDLRGGDSARLITVGHQPEGIAVTPDGGTVWAGSNRDSIVTVVHVRSGAIDTLRAFGMPYRIGITPDGRRAVISDPVKAQIRIFDVGSRRSLFTIDVPADSLVANPEVPGSPSPEGVATSRDSRWAFVTLQGRNRVVTIDLRRGTVVSSAPTGMWSDGVGFSPVTAVSASNR